MEVQRYSVVQPKWSVNWSEYFILFFTETWKYSRKVFKVFYWKKNPGTFLTSLHRDVAPIYYINDERSMTSMTSQKMHVGKYYFKLITTFFFQISPPST